MSFLFYEISLHYEGVEEHLTVSRFIAIVSSTLNVENFAMPFTYLNKLFQSTHAIDLVTLHQISKFEYN